MSIIGGYGTNLNTRIENLAEEADWAARRHGRDSAEAEEVLQKYLRALDALIAQRANEEGAHSVDLRQPKPKRKSVAEIRAERQRQRALINRAEAAG